MSVSQVTDVPMLSGGFITLGMVTAPTNVRLRRTKIICTIGPASWSEKNMGILLDSGMNVARLNFSHGDHPGHQMVYDRLRKVAREKNRNLAIILDTKGPEIRSGFFVEGLTKLDLVKGETIIMTGDYDYKAVDATKLACSYPQLATSVTPGQQILVADGTLVLTVLSCDPSTGEVPCRIENTTSIGERKNMNLPGVKVELPTFTEKDVDDIVNFGIKNGVEGIFASFVRTAQDVRNLRKLLADNGGPQIKIYCKIENQEGLHNYNEILKETDGIMVARGDLGMEIPPAKVFLAQKFMIRQANIAGKPVITATQMLESMITNPRPTRAECSDVANAVFDGTDAVMLSGESANSPYFEEAVTIMAATVTNAEMARNNNSLYESVQNRIRAAEGKFSGGEALASSAVKSAIDVGAKLIVLLSNSGKLGGYVSKFRPSCPVLMCTADVTVARQSQGLLLGMATVVVDSLDNADELIADVKYELLKGDLVAPDDMIVVLGGSTTGLNERVILTTVSDGAKHHNRLLTGGGFLLKDIESPSPKKIQNDVVVAAEMVAGKVVEGVEGVKMKLHL